MENLVKKYLTDNHLIPVDKYVQNLPVGGDEWEIYKINDKTVLYLFFELTDDGWGYVFCVKTTCEKLRRNTDYFYYAKSPSSFVKSDWENCPDEVKDKLMFDAINRLKVYNED